MKISIGRIPMQHICSEIASATSLYGKFKFLHISDKVRVRDRDQRTDVKFSIEWNPF